MKCGQLASSARANLPICSCAASLSVIWMPFLNGNGPPKTCSPVTFNPHCRSAASTRFCITRRPLNRINPQNHRPTDVPARLNYEKMTKIAEFLYRMVVNLLDERWEQSKPISLSKTLGTSAEY